MTKKWVKKKKAHNSHIEIPSSKIEMFGWHTSKDEKRKKKEV
jgi:hypothetical protein